MEHNIMTELARASETAPVSIRTGDIRILISAGLVALSLVALIGIYANPANVAPADPVATSFFP
jgi:hypothetical protein